MIEIVVNGEIFRGRVTTVAQACALIENMCHTAGEVNGRAFEDNEVRVTYARVAGGVEELHVLLDTCYGPPLSHDLRAFLRRGTRRANR